MSKPILAVVGRPNVGKSTFFNRIIGERKAIVEDVPGVTRDRIYAETEWNGREFAIIDTGGIEASTDDPILSQMRDQAVVAMDMADLILFMVDGKEGLTTADIEVGAILRRTGKKVILVVNKIDNPSKMPDTIYDFYELGLGEPIPISSANMLNIGDLLDEIVSGFPDRDYEADEENIKLAIIGKPNVGKSSLVNALTKENRVIVSPIAGTTRDSIDTPFSFEGNDFTLIDTAGLRRRSKVYDSIEKFSVIRAIAAIERCDICILMIDAMEGITEQDKKIAGIAHEAGKGMMIVINKWDLVEKETNTMRDMEAKVRQGLSYMLYAPVLFLSALTGQRVDRLFQVIQDVHAQNTSRITTGALNSVLADATARVQPPTDKGRRLKIFYMTQASTKPPHFVIFCNDARLFHFSYQRYLENQIREVFGLNGTPIRITIRQRGDKEDE